MSSEHVSQAAIQRCVADSIARNREKLLWINLSHCVLRWKIVIVVIALIFADFSWGLRSRDLDCHSRNSIACQELSALIISFHHQLMSRSALDGKWANKIRKMSGSAFISIRWLMLCRTQQMLSPESHSRNGSMRSHFA